jgi:small ligand-binding sensory domain FIST
VPFASSLSEHPVASQATGEVAGAVLESLGERPDLVVVTATRPHAGVMPDIVATVAAVLHPLALVGGVAESVVGTGHEIEETPAISLWAGRVGPLAPVQVSATRLADDTWHFAGWPDRIGFDPRALLLLADPFTFPAQEFLPVSRSSGGTCPEGVDPGEPRWSSGSAWSPPAPPGSSSAPGWTSRRLSPRGAGPMAAPSP